MTNRKITEKYEDVLQNLEFPIINIYRKQRDLIDAEVLTAIEALIRVYGAEAQGKAIGSRPVRGIAQSVMEDVQSICEWRLGRLPDLAKGAPTMPDVPPITLDELVECLKQIQSSIKFWSKERGRQGYLSYVDEFIT